MPDTEINTMSARDEMFARLFNNANNICTADGTIINNSDNPFTVNVSSIASHLIHEVGRWCDYYASDFIISWDAVRETIHKMQTSGDANIQPEIVIFAIRNSGVDGNAYLYNNMLSHDSTYIDNYYSRIYAVKISCEYPEDSGANYKSIVVELREIKRDVSSETYHMCQNKLFGGKN